MSTLPQIALNDGRTIPQLGFGVFQIPADETAGAVRAALALGYRHIDTAQSYRNERGVGEGVRTSGLDRGAVFITSKLNNDAHEPEAARRAFAATLDALGTDYLDLFLIHWPLPTRYGGDFVQTWRTLIEFVREGRARSIGVSNFQVPHLARLAAETDVVPAVNQIEVHPYLTNEAVRAYNRAHGIATVAWSPLAKGQVLSDPAVVRIAERVGRTPAQVVLRWQIERGEIIIPKSAAPARMRENLALFDFALDAADGAALAALDRGDAGRTGPHPDTNDGRPWRPPPAPRAGHGDER